MSKKIKNILSAPEVPEKLQPENIPALIENSSVRKNKIKHITRYVSAIAACAVIVTGSILLLPNTKKEMNMTASDNIQSVSPVFKGDVPQNSDASESTEDIGSDSSAKPDISANGLAFVPIGNYDDIYKQLKRNVNSSITESIKDFFYGGSKNEYFTDGVETDEEDYFNGDVSETKSPEEFLGTSAPSDENTDVYETLTQVEGIAEADIIKANANCVYFVNGKTLASVPFDNKTGKFGECTYINLSDISGTDGSITINDMYISENRLTVIAEVRKNSENSEIRYGYYNYYNTNTVTGVFVFDISENTPVLTESGFQSGIYSSSRMKDDILYLITNQTAYYGCITSKEKYEDYIPCFGNSIDEMKCIETDCIYIPAGWENESADVEYVNISGIDIYSPSEPVSTVSVAGYTGDIYCSNGNIYITQTNYNYGKKYTTSITRFSFENGVIAPQASGDIDGYILNQFSMDEWNGFFRAASTSYGTYSEEIKDWTEDSNNLYVLDMDMNIVGSITGFAKTETIKSVTFSGDTGYVVTYERTDPLFAIDLSDPYSPAITDEFKISGYSSFLRNWTDGKLLGFGIDANDDAIEVGVKLVMFDTSDSGDLQECGFYSISGERYHDVFSDAVYDRKALLIDSRKNLIGFPVTDRTKHTSSVYFDEYSNSIGGPEQTYRIFSYENGEFIEQCAVTASVNSYDSGFLRGIYIGDHICVFSTNEAVSVDMKTFKETDRVKFDGFEYDHNYGYWMDID